MPGRGKLVSRERTAKELFDMVQGLAARGIPQEEGLARLSNMQAQPVPQSVQE
jgi:hypothetical protein